MTEPVTHISAVLQHLHSSRDQLVAADESTKSDPAGHAPGRETIASISELWRAVDDLRLLLEAQLTTAVTQESVAELTEGPALLTALNSSFGEGLISATAEAEAGADLVRFAEIVGAGKEIAPELADRLLSSMGTMVISNAAAIARMSDLVGRQGNLVRRLYQAFDAARSPRDLTENP